MSADCLYQKQALNYIITKKQMAMEETDFNDTKKYKNSGSHSRGTGVHYSDLSEATSHCLLTQIVSDLSVKLFKNLVKTGSI